MNVASDKHNLTLESKFFQILTFQHVAVVKWDQFKSHLQRSDRFLALSTKNSFLGAEKKDSRLS